MQVSKLYIGPFKTGLEYDKEEFMLPNDAFTTIEDAYIFRDRVQKKLGYTLLGRLHRNPKLLPELLGWTVGAGEFFVGAVFHSPVSPGTVQITVGALQFADNGNGTLSETTGAVGVYYGTIEYESGTVDLDMIPGVGAAVPVNVTDYRYLARQPVMGIGKRELEALNRVETIAFDQNHSYEFNAGTGLFDEIVGGSWTSSTSDFFWTTNYITTVLGNRLFWATNNIAYDNAVPINDGIKYYNGAVWTTLEALTGTVPDRYLRGALIILPYKNRMIALNTLEGPAAPGAAVRHPQRARWSRVGDPTTLATSWLDDVVGSGGYINAPTNEEITSAWFNKDTLLVFFEKSTWQLRYTGDNNTTPFIWVRVNSELGALSPFSHVSFDQGIMAFGNHGIVLADGVNVKRIDEKVPDLAVAIEQENNGMLRVHGIRDLEQKQVYWTYTDHGADRTTNVYPNKVLSLNYDAQAYSIFNDTFTCFGHYQSSTDETWDTKAGTWITVGEDTWISAAQQAFYPDIIAGNQQSFVLRLKKKVSNSICLDLVNTLAIPSISNTSPAMLHIPNYNLETGQFIRIYNTFGFPINVVAEDLWTAPIGSLSHTAYLNKLGVMPTSLTVTDMTNTFQDLGNGTFSTVAGITGTIDYENGTITMYFPAALVAPLDFFASYTYNVLNYRIFYVVRVSDDVFEIWNVVLDDEGNEQLKPVDLSAGLPSVGAGSIEVIYAPNLKTKRFSPFIQESEEFRTSYFDMLTDTNGGNFHINVYADQEYGLPITTLQGSTENFEGRITDKHWNRYFPNVSGDFIQFEFKLSDYEMVTLYNAYSPFVLHALNIDVQPTGRIK